MRIVPDGPSLESVRAMLPSLPIAVLARAVASEGPFDFDVDERTGEQRFRCPVCHFRNWNAPSARIVDGARWACDSCGVSRTRWFLERIVEEDVDLLEHLANLLADEAAA